MQKYKLSLPFHQQINFHFQIFKPANQHIKTTYSPKSSTSNRYPARVQKAVFLSRHFHFYR